VLGFARPGVANGSRRGGLPKEQFLGMNQAMGEIRGPVQSAEQISEWPPDDEALLELGQTGGRPIPENYWTLKDAFEGVQVFGGTGSGKSSGSGKALALAFLEANMGGLVLTAKTDERLAWEKYMVDSGRPKDDLIIFGPDKKFRFNFLKYELEREGRGAGHTENLVSLFCSVLETAERKQGSGGGNDAYWQRTLKQLLRNTIDLAILAGVPMELPSLYRIITSAPQTFAQLEDEAWKEKSACFGLLTLAKANAEKLNRKDDFQMTEDYWLKEFPGLALETRSVIVSTFTSMADCFLRGMLRELFCTETNFKPEDCFDGKIILIDLPVKEFHELGQFAQLLFKYVWQRAVERRIPPGLPRLEAQKKIRPVFLYADESQFFASAYDALFQSTARSSRACTVYLTQNLPGYQNAFGASGGKAPTEAFLGNLQTKIFHANGDPQTNNWAADSIGRARQVQHSAGLSDMAAKPSGSSQNAGGTMVFEFVVQPQEFTMLKTGGTDNEEIVDAVIFQGGRRWVAVENGKSITRNFLRHGFHQNPKP
jgi:hypothetical protein